MKTKTDKTVSIAIEPLSSGDTEDFAVLIWEAFSDKLRPAFSNNRQAAIAILTEEMKKDLGSEACFAAKEDGQVVGGVMLKTVDTAKQAHPRNLQIYFQKLGFFKALKAMFFLAFENLVRVKKNEMVVDTLAVKEGYRGRGVGKKLLAFCQDYGRRHGKRFMTLAVVEKNRIALNLYFGFGFEKIKHHSMWLAEKMVGYRVWYIMRKEI